MVGHGGVAVGHFQGFVHEDPRTSKAIAGLTLGALTETVGVSKVKNLLLYSYICSTLGCYFDNSCHLNRF